MLLIHTALIHEAQPVAARLGLRPARMEGSIRLFGGDDIFLVVSGAGRWRACPAVAYALGFLRATRGSFPAVLNTGVCGAANPARELGETFLIQFCQEPAEGKRHAPDILFRHRLPEAGLHTFDQVVESASAAGESRREIDLVDMEAAGVWSAAGPFIPPSRIQSVKTVGDFLHDARSITPKMIEQRMEKAWPAISGFIEDYRRFLAEPVPGAAPDAGLDALLRQWETTLRLTETQRHRLRDAVRFAQAGRGEPINTWLGPPPASPPGHKRERERLFRKLLDKLHGRSPSTGPVLSSPTGTAGFLEREERTVGRPSNANPTAEAGS